MTTITFDTLSYARKLEQAGFTREQAEVQAQVQKEAFDELIQAKELATKKDLIELKYDLLKWQLGIGFALVVIMAKGFGWLGF